jgi:uncharacterized protein (DUF4415 family)
MSKASPTKGKTNWARLAGIGDVEIRRAVKADRDAAPIGPVEWFLHARVVAPGPKKAVSMRIDEDVLKWFKRQGKGYQTRMNAVLRAWVEAQS